MSRFVPIPSIIALSPKAATAVREAAAKRIMNAIARQQEQSTSDTQEEPTFEAKSINTQPRDTAFRSGYNNDILRSMVVVFRHADRGPKQKVKVKTRHPLFLRFFRKHSQKTEMKITQKKTPQQFMEAGDVIAAVIQEMSQQDLPSAASSPFTRTVTPTPITPKKTPTATNSTIPLRNQDSAMFPPSPMRVTLSQFDSELTEADQKFHEARRQRRQRTLFIANLAKLKQMQIVLRRNLDACKLQIKVLTANEDTGAPERVILICKWGGEITHAGIAQTKAYVPIFWDEMLRPQPPAPPQLTIDPVPMKASTPLAEEQTRQHLKEHAAEHARIAAQFTQVKVATPVAVRNEGDDNTDDSDNEGEEEPDAEEEIKVMQSYADPDYSQARTHFLDGMKVYASGEARVHATARAFIAATNQEEDEHISVQLISDDNVMTYLDDLNATSKQGIMIAKRDVVKLVTSKVNYFTSKSEIERKQIQKIKKTQQAAEQDHLSGSRRPSTQMLRTIASADDVASACEETDLDADEEAEEEKEDNPNVLSGDESEIDTLSVETLYEMRISRLDGDEDPDADIPPELTLPLPSNERDLQFAMTKWGVRCLRWLGVPNESLVLVYGLLKSFQRQIYQKLGLKWVSEELDTDIPEADSFQEYKREKKDLPSKTPNQKQKVFPSDYELCNGESLWNCKERWDALIRDFYDVSDQTFNCTKIPDLYDNIKYDVQHNRPFLKNLRSLYRGIKHVADFVIPQEYGVLRQEKLFIGKQICQKLLNRIVTNLEAGFKPEPETRVHLYFSSESHLHALRNILLLSGLPYNKTVATTLESIEINYLSHVVMRLFEDESRSLDDPKRFYVNVQVSSGAALDPFIFLKDQHLLPVSRPCPVNGRIPFEHFKKMFTSSSFEVVPIKY